MICTKCGTELHDQALQCWKCGNETPNYTDELKVLYQEEERLRARHLCENPDTLPPTKHKLVRVYRRSWFGRRLAGWVDENGCTYKSNWPFRPIRQPNWSVDERRRIYIEAGEHRALLGWLEENGAVYAQYGRPISGFFSYPESTRLFKPPVEFSPAPVFQASADGTLYKRGRQGNKTIGKVEGTLSLDSIAGLALVVLR
jgi:hypothetical protein